MLSFSEKTLGGQRAHRRNFPRRDREKYSTLDIATSVTCLERFLSGQIGQTELSVKFHVILHNVVYCYL